jgi:hypothetical protein
MVAFSDNRGDRIGTVGKSEGSRCCLEKACAGSRKVLNLSAHANMCRRLLGPDLCRVALRWMTLFDMRMPINGAARCHRSFPDLNMRSIVEGRESPLGSSLSDLDCGWTDGAAKVGCVRSVAGRR